MYERILLAYDGSLEGIIALREGALLAKRFGAKVFLLSVLPETEGMGAPEPNAGPYGDTVRQVMSIHTALLDRGVAALKRLGFEPVGKLVIGEPAQVISEFAREVGADLIVVGHRRQNLLQRWWSGSTGAYISDHISCSVLIGRKVINDEEFEIELRKSNAP